MNEPEQGHSIMTEADLDILPIFYLNEQFQLSLFHRYLSEGAQPIDSTRQQSKSSHRDHTSFDTSWDIK